MSREHPGKPGNPNDQKNFLVWFHSGYAIIAILICSLSLSVAAYRIADQYALKRAYDQFEYRVEKIVQDINDRMSLYEQVLRGGVGLLNSQAGVVSRSDWHQYVSTLDINRHWPGIQGIGYSLLIKSQDKDAHIAAIRKEGFPKYTIKPEGVRDTYTAIIYLEPFDWRNQRAFGYDMWSNPQRREAMQRAMDSGEAAVSGMITLLQETNEDVQKGFLMYVPVYKNDVGLETVLDRRNAFIGWVYSPFRAGDLMRGITGQRDPNIEFEIFDGDLMSQKWLLFSSTGKFHYPTENPKNSFSKSISLTVQGHVWTVYFSTPEGGARLDGNQQQMIIVGAVIVHAMLFYVMWSISSLRKKAFEIARDMTGNYDARTEELERVKNSLEEKVKRRTVELEKIKSDLEQRVHDRTQELEERMEELEIMNDTMIGRELKLQALRDENAQLKRRLSNRSGQNYPPGNI